MGNGKLSTSMLAGAILAGGRRPKYYVNSVTGADANDGLAPGTPWATLDYAVAMLTAGDELIVSAPATTPYRNGFAPAVKSTVRGATSANRAHILGSVDVSPGKTIENFNRNGGCEAWLTATSLWAITRTTGDPIAKSTDAHGGTYSIQATKTAASIWLDTTMDLPAGANLVLTYWHKAAGSIRWKFNIKEQTTPIKYLQADGSWSTTSYLFDPNDANAAWHAYSKAFTTNAAGRYTVTLSQQYTGTAYLDDISVLFDGVAAYAWGDVVGKNYKVLNVPFSNAPSIFAKCTAAAWTSDGLDALSVVPVAADEAALDATPNSWLYDAATDLVYYCPAVGETVADMHFELSQPRLSHNGVTSAGLVVLNVNGVSLSNLNLKLSDRYGVLTVSSATGLKLNHIDSSYAGDCCYRIASGELTANDCTGKYTYGEDVFSVDGVGTQFTANRCLAEYGNDDGFQVTAGGNMTANYCISRHNGLESAADNSGFGAEGADVTMALYNCVAYDNYGLGISHAGTGSGSATVKNCIAYGTQSGAGNDAHTSVVHSTFTHTNNIFGGNVLAWVVDATEQVADPLFTDPGNGDLTLQAGSPAIDTGVDVGLTTDYAGNPVPLGAAPDCGAYEKA
jgi:hypothetical protein